MTPTSLRRSAPLRASVAVALGTLIALALTASMAAPAGAHARLDETSPAPGSTLLEAPAEVALLFNEPVELTGAGIVVTGPVGRVDRADASHRAPDLVAVTLGDSLAAGPYEVAWEVRSADGHIVGDRWSFTIAEGPTELEAAPTDTPADVEHEAEVAAPADQDVALTADQTDGPSFGLLAVLGLIGLLALGVGAWALVGQGRRSGTFAP